MMNPLPCQAKAMDISGLGDTQAQVYAIRMRGRTPRRGHTPNAQAPPTSPVVPTITDTRITLSITNR